MRGLSLLFVLSTALLIACGDSKPPNGPTPTPRLSRTRFLAFGDSFTAGEVTNPSTNTQVIGKFVLVPSASYPSVLQSRLQATYTNQVPAISVTNAGEPSERILDGAQRFPGVFDATRPEVLLIMEGANCEECVMPVDILQQIARDVMSRQVPGVTSVTIDDPRVN